MAWQKPKTDWTADDFFEYAPDWQRITNNLLYLKQQARPIVGDIIFQKMEQPATSGLPFAEVLQAVEDNTEALRLKIPLAAKHPRKRIIEDNGSVWDFKDLNRLEKNAFDFNKYLFLMGANRQTLAFTLGGGAFATGI